jgi:hypothetical protein
MAKDELITSQDLPQALYESIRQVLSTARAQAARAVNWTMVEAYWQIGRLIVEEEQQGQSRAEYGTRLIETLAERLVKEFGKGYEKRNLQYFRQFYLTFPKVHALRAELSWTHYRELMRVKDEQARQWYLKEAAEQGWSYRALARQINVLFYERLLASQFNVGVKQEGEDKSNCPSCSTAGLHPGSIRAGVSRTAGAAWFLRATIGRSLTEQPAILFVGAGQRLCFCSPSETNHG